MDSQSNHAQSAAIAENHPISKDKLLQSLNELLEAERAGARVTLETANQMGGQDLANLVMDIQHDEVRWCKMLMAVIESLDETPSRMTGAFYEKAIAIPEIPARLSFINRGQAWVVKRLQALIPRIQDAHISKELQAMLGAHIENIERVEKKLKSST